MDYVPQVRHFNRTITQRIGLLEEHFLGRNRSLGASRFLFEIGSRGAEVRTLRSRLGLDSGYTSRLLRVLQAEGLVRVQKSPDDARVRYVTLTEAGNEEVGLLNQLSDEAAASILEPLNEEQQKRLVTSMRTVEKLLTLASLRVEITDPSTTTAQLCLSRYYKELADRFDSGFNPAQSISATATELTPPSGYFIVAELNNEGVGCGALKCHPAFGEVKRMWVDPSLRGFGIGRRILSKLEELARDRQIPMLRLETNRALVEAQELYLSSGFREVEAFNDEPYAHHWFEKPL